MGSFKPNPFGLYDTVGNVWEWVADSYHNSYKRAPDYGSIWKENDDGGYKILRGGSWFNMPNRGWLYAYARAANRYAQTKTHHDHHVGFRCSLTLE